MFHQVLAEIPLISYCKVFTNKGGLLYFTQYILRSIPFVSVYIKTISIRFWVYWLSFVHFSQPLLWHFACLQISTKSPSASLLEHCQCFPREDVFLVFALGSVWGNTVPRDIFPCTLPRTQGVYWISSNINPVASEYQEIHSYSALIIDSVKINTSLLMMREWWIS